MVQLSRPTGVVVGLGLTAAAIAALMLGQRGTPGSLLPHGYCFTWNPALLWTHVISDSLISAAYVTIPFALLYLVRRRTDIPFDWIVMLFAIFIVSCGATHAIEVWTVWHPDYWLSAVVKVITAIASLLTAGVLVMLMPRILAIPTVAELTAAKDALEREIEARREVERVLVRERGELEQRVRERTEELERATAEAKQAHAQADQANRMKDTFLAKVSHELRTPLQAMLSWAQILERAVLDPDRARHAAERIVANVKSQARMIDDLLDISRMLSGKLSLQPELIEVAPTVRSAVEVVRSSSAGTDVAIEVAVGEAPLWIRADPARMEQVLWNLASNALHAAEAGGRVRIECDADATHVLIRVQDWGQGIDADDLPHLFEPFRQSRHSRNLHHGLGLGLAIARNIVELSGGELGVRSSGPGCGATFTVRLPRADVQPTVEAVGRAALGVEEREHLRGLRVLYVENEPEIAAGIADILSALGMHVDLCLSREQAIARLERGGLDLMICDLHLGDGKTALDLPAHARDAGGATPIPALVLSAFGSDADRSATRKAGFAVHLVKPTDMETLARALLAVTNALPAKSRPTPDDA